MNTQSGSVSEAEAMDEALATAAVLGAALARFENAVDRLKEAQAGKISV